MDDAYLPLPGSTIFNALRDKPCIVMAANVRIVPGVLKGLFRAARDSDSAVLFEIARSESNLEKGYTGMTPMDYGRLCNETAQEVGFDVWGLHADPITLKKGASGYSTKIPYQIGSSRAWINTGYIEICRTKNSSDKHALASRI